MTFDVRLLSRKVDAKFIQAVRDQMNVAEAHCTDFNELRDVVYHKLKDNHGLDLSGVPMIARHIVRDAVIYVTIQTLWYMANEA